MPRGPKRPPPRREHTGSAQADRMQTVGNELAEMLRRCPFSVGKLVTVTLEGFVTKVVWHRLGVPASCMVVRLAAGTGVLSEVLTTNHDENNALPIVSTGDGTYDLWFYPRASKPVDPATGQSR